jgi:hypothetical protein
MELLNIQEAYTYLDGLTDDRERSAALAIHLAFMRHCSSPAEVDQMTADAPLDLLLLYRAAVAAFREPPVAGAQEHLSTAGKVINRGPAQQRLEAITDEQMLRPALRFVAEVISHSADSPCEQDLLFFLDLFLLTIGRCSVEAIESGEISRASRRLLEDPDYW